MANTLKYLDGQPLIGVNPDPKRWDGQLLPFTVRDLDKVVREVLRRRRPTKAVTMAKATLNTGLTLHAVNDFFVGARTHISARYRIQLGKAVENHSSSGVIVSTGLGSTGWLKSLLTGAAAVTQSAGSALAHRAAGERPGGFESAGATRHVRFSARTEFPWDADYLCFTVREPFPSVATATSLDGALLAPGAAVELVSEMDEGGVLFADGIEADRLEFPYGTRARFEVAPERLRLARAA